MGVIFANTYMNNKCINLKQKFDRSLYCKINECTITFKDCSNCKYKEYKDNKKSTLIKKSPIKGKKHKLTKETEISKNVKMIVSLIKNVGKPTFNFALKISKLFVYDNCVTSGVAISSSL